MYQANTPHSFYIPVMGTGFTIDTPLFVAKYGISSVISLVDDVLIEQMRKHWCQKAGEPYEVIGSMAEDARARRITAYLNLIHKLVTQQIAAVKAAPFEPESDITRYFELLPHGNPLKQLYEQMVQEPNRAKQSELQAKLRQAITAGSIDVNIMTKIDGKKYTSNGPLPYEFCDAAAALRGYAQSDLASTIVFSAGFNANLYGYIAKFADFFPNAQGEIKKKVCLKVTDYRSAATQGKYLAKHGIWVSEYQIESPLNCGGHAFINDGHLLGPILAEFKQRKNELIETLHGVYKQALSNLNRFCADTPYSVKITAQGGIGTNAEHEFLLQYYELDSAGWGSPFLLVPEATNVDEETLRQLIEAKEEDIYLSSSSPLGIPFWNLRNSASEELRRERIKNNKPGSPCPKGYLRFNQEFTDRPICRASSEYQTLKLKELDQRTDLAPEKLAILKEEVLEKSCICHDLSGSVSVKSGVNIKATPAICPGPNIINFKKTVTLREMIDHIYGRGSLLAERNRPHLFIKEIQLQISYILSEIKRASVGLPARSQQKLTEVKQNLQSGIDYYRNIAKVMLKEQHDKFLQALDNLYYEINEISLAEVPTD